ncbi:hypothetical protein V6Z12_A12G195000 [Gossypium hirsutum]
MLIFIPLNKQDLEAFIYHLQKGECNNPWHLLLDVCIHHGLVDHCFCINQELWTTRPMPSLPDGLLVAGTECHL